ncbi:DUF945 domain-containing protein [Acidobacteria bacterium AH-259-L09]|nr:DUF945 domain-containing protein [Acidobacteria bacterium AH-259-L09]
MVRNDTEQALSVVSDRYTFVPHQRLLDTMQEAVRSLDVGPVPRGVYVDRQGARMRAIFKFPALRQALTAGDEMCPCVQIANTYDGTSRVKVSIGAFNFVCTNLAVGGGGVFAGGFMAVHAGEIPVEEVGQQLAQYLSRFDHIVEVYRAWMEMPAEEEKLNGAFEGVSRYHLQQIQNMLPASGSVCSAYNTATAYATHETRSAAVAFALLERINQGFQKVFPVR